MSSLIQTATLAYNSPTAYTRWAPGQEPFTTLISTVVAELPSVLEQDERDRIAGKEVVRGPVEWGSLNGGKGVKSGEVWSTA